MSPRTATVEPVERHPLAPDAGFDGGDLDCGGGLLLLIRRHIDPLEPGALLEIRSTEPTVEVELPAWCRLTGNELVSWTKRGARRTEVANRALPEPPAPPTRHSHSSSGWVRSCNTSPLAASRTTVPGGTGIRNCLPAAP